jgi:hypothetical protein
VNKCYTDYCIADARKSASERKSPILHNLLVRLGDFSTVIKAHQAMKAGDIGRLMNV